MHEDLNSSELKKYCVYLHTGICRQKYLERLRNIKNYHYSSLGMSAVKVYWTSHEQKA